MAQPSVLCVRVCVCEREIERDINTACQIKLLEQGQNYTPNTEMQFSGNVNIVTGG